MKRPSLADVQPSPPDDNQTIRRPPDRTKRANGDITRARILDCAERLFAEQGFEAVSVRSVTLAAGINVAAVHFHFASKEALFEAVFNRRIEPLNAERMRRLENVASQQLAPREKARQLVLSIVEPHCDLFRTSKLGGTIVMQFVGRASTDPSHPIQPMLRKYFGPLWYRFEELMCHTLSEMPDATVKWRCFFIVTLLHQIDPSRNWIANYTNGACDLNRVDELCNQLVDFLMVGTLGPPLPSSVA